MKKITKDVISEKSWSSMLISDNGNICTDILTDCAGKCNQSPVIILPGINHSPTYLFDKNNQPVTYNGKHIGETLFIPDTSALDKKKRNIGVKKAVLSVLLQKNTGLYEYAYNLISDLLGFQKCDNNGNPVENLKTKRWLHSLDFFTDEELDTTYSMVPMESLVREIGKDHIYFFTFNLVGDPMDSADDLDDYIKMVKQQTGHDKVILLPISLGGTILTAYLDKYGHKNIEKIINIVACLDGTDIFADIFAREWRLDNKYLYHEYLAKIFTESNKKPTIGYLLNFFLHLFPRSAINAVLSGAISSIIDTIMVNAPQFWAMLPSYRYTELSERYLKDKPLIKARADRFQQARLNLRENIIKAHNDGVIINSIACANLDFGEQMYTYLNIVATAEKVNSDGIVNLSSATMGATGAVHKEVLSPGSDPEKNKYYSPDMKVDASTAVLPDNTWIFLNQHHEVEKNDTVLNLTKALVTGEINNINDNSSKYPQYNGTCNTRALHRWRLPDAYKINREVLSAEDNTELTQAIAQAENVLSMTIADSKAAQDAEIRLTNILYKIGVPGYKKTKAKKDSPISPILELAAYALSKSSLFIFGGGSPIDRILSPIRKHIKQNSK